MGFEVNLIYFRVRNNFSLAIVWLNVPILQKICFFLTGRIVVIMKHGFPIHHIYMSILVVHTITSVIDIVLDTSAFCAKNFVLFLID